ncbi:retromer subunit VPS35 [Sporobolomyces koalae]|uniref:retromer subunit VPS35 n=1 Tax=Sporobolomyces koalae TaxID=500713 RepID=UPI003176C6DA
MAPAPVAASIEEGKLLSEALATVQTQLVQLKRCLDSDQIMDALKAASTMLAELRTSSLSPKQYYELYMAVFDALRHLSSYLYDAHVQGKHHLADLYELVQYAGNIVPRLYLMITVGTVYMSIPGAPIKEIMKDMMEMTRGVQHPTRGLFLRHYLSGMTRDHLPIGDDLGPAGNLQDSIGFVLTNFIEMNKLWVRLQHAGLSRDKDRRELERRELRILVGTNLVRLSQLEGVGLELYRRTILPSVLEQVVNCKDVIAQEYLMEVVIQVFTDDFHLRTLSPFLSATAQLHPKVNIKQIVIALIDRLAAYAAREAENESPEERAREEEEQAKKLLARVRKQRERNRLEREARELNDKFRNSSIAGTNAPPPPPGTGVDDDETEGWGAVVNVLPPGQAQLEADDGKIDGQVPRKIENGAGSAIGEGTGKKYRGIPEDVRLFEVFWTQVVNLIKARPDLSIQDVTALLVSLANLSLSCYPSHLEYIDQVLSFALSQCQLSSDSPDLHHPTTTSHLLSLLLAPIQNYLTVLTLLALPNYAPLLRAQPYASRRSIAHAIVANVLRNETVIDTREDVEGILELCHVLVRDQKDRPTAGRAVGMDRSMSGGGGGGIAGYIPQFGQGAGYGSSAQQQQQQLQQRGLGQGYDREEMAEEQGWIARMVQLFRAENLDTQFTLLQTARKEFSEGGDRIRWTFPPLIIAAIKLSRRYKRAQNSIESTTWDAKVSTLFKFIHQATSILYNKVESSSDICLRLYLLSLSAADETGFEELAYEFAVQAFTIYEESISESRAQLQAITTIISALQVTRVFGEDNYDTLITKAALHGAKLLKKGQQATAVAMASHLWWQTELPGRDTSDNDKPPYRDGKRVLECLQKALRIATSSIDELTSVQLYCDALDQYLYYFERGVDAISAKHINSLVELITSNLDSLPPSTPNPNQNAIQHQQFERHPPSTSGATSGLIEGLNTPEAVLKHFKNSLNYIQGRKLGRGPELALSHNGTSAAGSGGGEVEQIQKLYRDVEVQGVLLKLGVPQ